MKPFLVGSWLVRPDEGTLSRGEVRKRLQPKVMLVLQCLAGRPGEVISRESLLRAVWGDRAVSDEPLTRCIGELRSAFEDNAGTPEYIETLPKRGYRLLAPVAPVSPASNGPLDLHAAASRPGLRRRWLALALFALVVTAVVWWWNFFPPPPAADPAPGTPYALAVLPFVNIGASDDEEALADGMTETLTHMLSRNDRLRVVARTSAFAFKGRALDVRDIGRQLGVDALLEGSVQRDGGTLRVTAQLVDSASGVNLWSSAFDRPVASVLVVQDEIASAVAAALHAALLDADAHSWGEFGAENFDAYLAYAHGLEGLRLRTTASLAAAIGHFRRAVELDGSFAMAWVGLAETLMVNQWYADVPLDDSLRQAEEAVGQALALDPNLGEAWSVVGLMEFRRADYVASERALQRAVALAPSNARAWFLYGTLLNDTGRPAEALEKHRTSAGLDPLAPVVLTAIGVALEKLGRFDEALEQYRKVTRVDAAYPAAHDRLGILHWTAYGRAHEALEAHRVALRLDPQNTWTRPLVVELALGLDHPTMAEGWLEDALRTGASKLYPNQSLALLMAYRGDDAGERMALARRWLDNASTYTDRDMMLRLYRDAALERGEIDRALQLYREVLPQLFEPGLEMTTALFGPAIDLAWLLRLTGDRDLADALLNQAWKVVETLPRSGCCGYGLADVEILAIGGRLDAAVTRLQEAFDAGFRSSWWWHTRGNPNLSSLEDRADYRALIDRFRARAAEDRSTLRGSPLP